MIDAMLMHGSAERTHRSYRQAISHLTKCYHHSPDLLTTDPVSQRASPKAHQETEIVSV